MISIPPLTVPPVTPMTRPTPRPLRIDPACVFYWNGIDKLSTVKVLDESGKGNHGTINGASWMADGLLWDGDDDDVTIPADSSMNVLNGNPFSLVIGHKFTTLPSAKGVTESIFAQKGGTGTGRNWLVCNNSDNGYRSSIGGVPYNPGLIATDGWHLIILRFDGTDIDMTLDNVTTAGAARTPEAADGDFIIGRHQATNSLWFDGTQNEISLYDNKFLSAAEMAAIYDQWRARL